MIIADILTLSAVFCCGFITFFLAYIYINYKRFLDREEKKNTFVATVTHDLKTPANAQIKALDLLLENTFGELKTEQREIITEIKNSCKYMNTLIYSILDTCKRGSGEEKLKFEEFDFIRLIEECIKEISYLANEKGQKINFISAQTPLFISADRTQIKRVIINLVGNAVWYGRRNTVIDIETKETNGEILNFTVKNHSRYIPKEKLNTLFEKYKTAGSGEEKTGNGLGLFLSRQIILAHKGKMSARSEENNICTFGFSIPENIKRENTDKEKMVC